MALYSAERGNCKIKVDPEKPAFARKPTLAVRSRFCLLK
jgi:hypothetical protein